MLELEVRKLLTRMHGDLGRLLADADRLAVSLLAAKLAEAIEVVERTLRE